LHLLGEARTCYRRVSSVSIISNSNGFFFQILVQSITTSTFLLTSMYDPHKHSTVRIRTVILKQKSELHLEHPMATASKVLTSQTNPLQKKLLTVYSFKANSKHNFIIVTYSSFLYGKSHCMFFNPTHRHTFKRRIAAAV